MDWAFDRPSYGESGGAIGGSINDKVLDDKPDPVGDLIEINGLTDRQREILTCIQSNSRVSYRSMAE